MLGKILIIALVILGAVIGYEYYIGNTQIHPLSNSGLTTTTRTSVSAVTTTTIISTAHYFNFSAFITVYSNGTTNYIYPVNLPSSGDVTILLVSNSTFHVRIYDNNNLIAQYSGQKYYKTFQGSGELEFIFYNFTGNLSIFVNEVY